MFPEETKVLRSLKPVLKKSKIKKPLKVLEGEFLF